MRSVILSLTLAASAILAGEARAQGQQNAPRNHAELLQRHDAELFQRRADGVARFRGQLAPGQNSNFLAWTVETPNDPALGVTLAPVSDRLRAQLRIPEGHGLVAGLVDPDGPAGRAGLRTNDVLLSLGDDALAKPEDLSALLKEAKDSSVLPLKILRGGKPVTLKVRRVVTVTLGPEEEPQGSDYVLGVAVSVPDDALRAQLDLAENRGLLVDQVVKGSAAEKGGIQQNDVLLSIAGQSLDGTEALIKQVRESKDKPTELRLIREGKEITLVVTPEKRPLKDRLATVREPLRMYMFDPSNPNTARVPGLAPMPPMNVPGFRVQPFAQGGSDDRVEQLESELKSLRKSIDELKDALKSSKSPRDNH